MKSRSYPRAFFRCTVLVALAMGIVCFNVRGKSIEAASDNESDVIFPKAGGSLSFSHFSWGAEVGSSIDLTSQDLSTFDIDAQIGYKNSIIKLIGVGAGIHRGFHTGTNFIPVYLVFRSSFRRKPSLFFLNLQAGYSFYSISHAKSQGDLTGSLGLGINLSKSSSANSFVILSANYQRFSNSTVIANSMLEDNNVFFAKLAIGVSF